MISIVIPTRHADRLQHWMPCVEAGHRLVAVMPEDPGIEGVVHVEAPDPFVYAKAINRGVEKAHRSGFLVIVGDDVRCSDPVETINALVSTVRKSGAAAVAPLVDGVCGCPEQRYSASKGSHLKSVIPARWVTFIMVVTKRWIWDANDGLDENFDGYGYDDVDWCLGAMHFGRILVDADVCVEHVEGMSEYRSKPWWKDAYEHNRKLFEMKWSG